MISSLEKVNYQYTDSGNKFVTSLRHQFTTSVNCPKETLIEIRTCSFRRSVSFKNKESQYYSVFWHSLKVVVTKRNDAADIISKRNAFFAIGQLRMKKN